MQIIHEISIDFQRVGIRPRIHVKENDAATRFVHVAFYDDGTPYAVTTSTTTALMCYAKPDGTSGVYDHIGEGEEEHQAYHFDSVGKGVTIELAPSMMVGFGLLCCEVRLVQDGDILGTFTFDVDVEKSVTTGTKADDYFSYRAIDALYKKDAEQDAEINIIRGELENLAVAADGNLYTSTTDSTAAYVKTVPANALPVANVDAIGGLTKLVDGNLVNADVTRITSAGIESKAVPDALRQVEGWGVGFSSVLYNALRGTTFERKFVIVRIDGSNVISRSTSGGVSFVNLSLPSPPLANSAHAIDSYGDRMPGGSSGTSGSVRFISGNARRFDDAYTSVAEAKRLLDETPLILMYELATEQEVDVSDIISADFSQLHVAAGGSIVFEQANGTLHDIHSEITYAIKIGG